MDSLQRFTEEEIYYECDNYFIEKIREYPIAVGLEIAHQLDISHKDLPSRDGWTQRASGVCLRPKEPMYFEVEYLKEPYEAPVFLDINEIDADEFLDYVIENKQLKSNIKRYVQTDSRP
jgi:hypothetical protein